MMSDDARYAWVWEWCGTAAIEEATEVGAEAAGRLLVDPDFDTLPMTAKGIEEAAYFAAIGASRTTEDPGVWAVLVKLAAEVRRSR